jgi:hypothetical protein
MNLQVYKAYIDPSFDSDLEVDFIGLVERPAIERNFQAFDEEKKKLKFSLDTERRIVSGPAMIAGMPLYRNDNVLGEYFVEFDAPSIFTIVNKFAAKGNMQKANLFHDPNLTLQNVTFFNSFITDEQMGIMPPKGFEDIAFGSWFISAYIGNDAAWEAIQSGQVKGFSVEGIFKYIAVKATKMTMEMKLERIKKILEAPEE